MDKTVRELCGFPCVFVCVFLLSFLQLHNMSAFSSFDSSPSRLGLIATQISRGATACWLQRGGEKKAIIAHQVQLGACESTVREGGLSYSSCFIVPSLPHHPVRQLWVERVSGAHKTTCKREDKCQSVKDPSLSGRPFQESKQAQGSRALPRAP